MRISDSAFDLIVREEVTSRAHYEKALRRPTWPGAASGATVGIGYDLGQTAAATITADWQGRVSPSMLAAMVKVSGETGAAGQAAAAAIRDHVDIPWDVALAVHRERVVPRWEATVRNALPNTDELPPDCFGALVSLTFNRGASFGRARDPGDTLDRYREMRAIKTHMAARAFARIPAEIRSMTRLWAGKGLDGLLRRRDAEAALFEAGLASLSSPSPLEGEGRGGGYAPPAAPAIITQATPAPAPPLSPAGEGNRREAATDEGSILSAPSDLATRIVAALERRGARIDRGPGEVNIIYVEGLDPDGTPNANRRNGFDDTRFVITFDALGRPAIAGAWEATTEPGRHYTETPLSRLGAARIVHGQQACWQVGTHHAGKPSAHEALVQTGAAVTVTRDGNRDYSRAGDAIETGFFGINQHHGYDNPKGDIKTASAGCLVGRTVAGHRAFMALVKRDPRYLANKRHIFATTVLPAAEVLAPIAAPPLLGPAVVLSGAAAASAASAAAAPATGSWLAALLVAGAIAAAALAVVIVVTIVRRRKRS